jgi:hypothetical protein
MTAEYFFPVLEMIMQNISQSQSPNQITLMHLISKIFYSANQVFYNRFVIMNSALASNCTLLHELTPENLTLG